MAELVLVTGISGFLGGHVALQLLKKGYRVRGSLRSLKKAEKVRATMQAHGANIDNLEFVALDLNSDDGWDAAMEGVNFLQHIASPFVIEIPDDKFELIRPAVDGTTRALQAAFKASVQRIVVTSSFAAIGYGHDTKNSFTADDWTRTDGPTLNAYVESKTLAEQAAWALAKQANRTNDLATINPGLIVGPLLDDDTGTSGAIIQDMLTGKYPAAPKIAMIIVDVRDVAEMHVAAMEKPDAGGSRYPASAGTFFIYDIGQMAAKALPEFAGKVPKFALPNWITRTMALFSSELKSVVSELGQARQLDNTSLQKLLGHDAIPAEQAVGATATSLKERNLI